MPASIMQPVGMRRVEEGLGVRSAFRSSAKIRSAI
jgi:hypothetical protein